MATLALARPVLCVLNAHRPAHGHSHGHGHGHEHGGKVVTTLGWHIENAALEMKQAP